MGTSSEIFRFYQVLFAPHASHTILGDMIHIPGVTKLGLKKVQYFAPDHKADFIQLLDLEPFPRSPDSGIPPPPQPLLFTWFRKIKIRSLCPTPKCGQSALLSAEHWVTGVTGGFPRRVHLCEHVSAEGNAGRHGAVNADRA